MSIGNLLYLLMCVGTFTVFGVVLAYQSWRQGKPAPKMTGSVADDDPHLDYRRGHTVHVR